MVYSGDHRGAARAHALTASAPFTVSPGGSNFGSVHSYCLTKRPDTVGQPPSTEMGVLNMPSLKAKKLRKLLQEKVLLEL